MKLLLRWLVPFVAVLVAPKVVPDLIVVNDLAGAAAFALVLALLNAFVRPVISLLAMPITCLTLGLFHFVINALLFGAAAYLAASFLGQSVVVNGPLGALAGAILVSVVGLLMSLFVK